MRSVNFVGIIFLLFSSCVYDNDEVYVNPISPPTGIGSSIDLNSVTDPIVINQATAFRFTVYPSGKKSYAAVVKIDGSIVYSLTSTTGEFYFVFVPEVNSKSEKKLRIEATYLSQSPSLAGKLGLETITFSKEWQIHIDTSIPSPISSPQVYLENGKSMLSWNSPDKFTFAELIIFRTYFDENGNYAHRDSIKIEDHHTTVFHDASYVGGPVRYTIDLKGYHFYVKGGESSFNIKPIAFKVDSLADPIVFSWQKSPLYNNDISIVIGNTYAPNQPGSQTTYARFGQPSGVTYKIRANHPPPSQVYTAYDYEGYVSAFKGIKIPAFSSLTYLPALNSYLLTSGKTLYKIDASTLSELGRLVFSYDGDLTYSADGAHVYFRTFEKFYKIDAASMTIQATIDLAVIMGQASVPLYYSPGLSNDNILTFIYGVQSYAVDLNTRQVVWQKSGGFPAISPDSKYIYHKGSVYIRSGNNWNTLLATLVDPDIVSNVEFRQGAQNLMVTSTYTSTTGFGKSFHYDLNLPPDGNGNLNPISSVPYGYSYDQFSEKYLKIEYYESWIGKAFVYNDQSFTELRTLDDIYEPSHIVLMNGHFFHAYGYYFP